MNEIRLGEKGQITLPKAFRDHYGLEKGDLLKLVDLGNGILEIVLVKPSMQLKPPVFGSLRRYSVEDMNDVIGKTVVEKYKGK
jgi:AbrB family looped-hinge helix DNA binding protein